MIIYVSSSVIVKLDEYVEFLMRTCHYNIDEAETRRWEVEHQVNQHCNPILMKAGSSGTIKFKSVLQRQEIERFVNNRSQLMKIIKRRNGNKGNTQWNVDYMVSNQGNVYITAIKCYNTFSESVTYQGLQQLINECVDKCLRKYLKEQTLNETLNNFDAPLYHNTSMENLIKMMSSNSIKSDYHRGYNTQDTHNGICFTRYKTYNPYTYYDVRLTFDVNKIGKLSRGLTLLSYQDKEWADLDEYEERLVSRNGKPFILNNLSNMITEVVIVLDRTCSDINENGYDVGDYIEDLEHIIQYNIFGEKLKIVDNLKSMNRMSINDACDYIINQCADDEYYNSYQVYCVEYYDVSDESWEYSEYTQNRNEAIKTAKQMYEDDGIPTRVTFGEYDGQEYELSSIVQKFGNVDW